METTKNTVLISGGSAGIGFEIASLLSTHGNHVIILGRDKDRLQEAAARLNNVTAIVSDVTKQADVDHLVERLYKEFPNLNMVINNAGRAHAYKLSAEANAWEKASDEMLTNYLSVIRLTEKLLPLLSKQEEAAIVNVSSIVALVPGMNIPTYSASKAALHSYTQLLRLALVHTPVKVFELMPPLVNTELSKEIGGANGIAPAVVAKDLYEALEINNYEIHVGNTAMMYQLSLQSPAEALQLMNQNR